MPTADLDAVCALLPTWAVVGAWLATPLLACLSGWAMIWLCARCHRTPVAGLHWTEIARRQVANNALVGSQMFLYLAMVVVVTYASASGVLVRDHRLTRAVIASVALFLATRGIAYHRAHRVKPWLTVGEFVRGHLFVVVVVLPLPALAIALGIAAPATFTGREWQFAAVHGGGLVLMVWLLRGGGITLGRASGLIVPAAPALRALVADVERRTGHTAAQVWVARTPVANAAALPRSNALLVTTRAIEALTDAELTAVLLHEFGHLRENVRDRWRRGIAVVPWFVLALAQPLLHQVGSVGLVLLLLLAFAVAIHAGRAARRLEVAADAHAQAHAHGLEAGIYARSLERLYRDNLVPAVMRGQRHAHPHLYDRMLAAGVTPDYARPLPPRRRVAQAVLFAALAIAVELGQIALIRWASARVYDHPTAAGIALALSGGSLPSIAAYGYHWQESQPEHAITVLAFAAANSDWPDYPARLACLLAASDPVAATACLQRAEATCADWPEVADWLRDEIDTARERLGLPPRTW